MLRVARVMRAGIEAPRKGMTYLAFSHYGPFTTYSLRQRYPIFQKMTTDSAVGDRLFHIWVKDWCGDPPQYNFVFVTVASVASSVFALFRLLYFDPDVTFRREHQKLPQCDKKRLHMYALPFYNHRLRNWSTRYNWMFCGADHDWSHKIYTGQRPERANAHRRPFFWSVCHWYCHPYPVDDQLHTTCSVENTDWIYHECGYKDMSMEYPEWAKKSEGAEEEEEE